MSLLMEERAELTTVVMMDGSEACNTLGSDTWERFNEIMLGAVHILCNAFRVGGWRKC